MIDASLVKDRPTLLRVILFWTLLLSGLLTVSDDFSLSSAPGRFFYWVAHIGLGLILVSWATQCAQRFGLSRLTDWWQLGVSCVIAVIVFAPVGIILDLLIPESFGPAGHADLESSAQAQGVVTAVVDEIGAYAPTVVVVWLIVHLSYRFLNSPTLAPTSESIAENQPTVPNDLDNASEEVQGSNIIDKIPDTFGREIVLIRSDANYVHVHTTRGKTMFLYSLAQAVEDLDTLGLLVHRSYWVSFDNVNAVKRKDNQMICVMSDGTSVPVSRRRQKAVVDHFGRDFVRADSTTQANPTS